MRDAFLPANRYAAFAKNNFSQFGEDGIVEKLLQNIPDKNKWCVEFGAWDGIYLSNAFNLIKNESYRAVLIEANSKKFEELASNLKEFDVVLVNEFVTFDGENTLDKILSRTEIPNDFDFLSIDIDGNDYYILESLSLYKPKIICIEYNFLIPNEVVYVQPKDFNIQRGASAKAILNLAKDKGYSLAAVTTSNLILVDRRYENELSLTNADLSEFRDDSSTRVFVFPGYDGRICLSKPLMLGWHNVIVDEDDIQILPSVLRRYRLDYNLLQKILYVLFILIKSPSDFVRRVKRAFKSRA